jgi:hypothetical protein
LYIVSEEVTELEVSEVMVEKDSVAEAAEEAKIVEEKMLSDLRKRFPTEHPTPYVGYHSCYRTATQQNGVLYGHYLELSHTHTPNIGYILP